MPSNNEIDYTDKHAFMDILDYEFNSFLERYKNYGGEFISKEEMRGICHGLYLAKKDFKSFFYEIKDKKPYKKRHPRSFHIPWIKN